MEESIIVLVAHIDKRSVGRREEGMLSKKKIEDISDRAKADFMREASPADPSHSANRKR